MFNHKSIFIAHEVISFSSFYCKASDILQNYLFKNRVLYES